MATTQRRRRASREPQETRTTDPLESYSVDPAPVEAGAVLLDDSSAPITSHRRGLPLGKSIPGAVLGTLLIAGLAFGAALGPIALLSGGAGNTGDGTSHGGTTAGLAGTGIGSGDATTPPTGGGDGQPAATQGSGDGSTDGAGATDNPGGDAGEPTANPEPTTNPEPTRNPEPTHNPEPTSNPTENPGPGAPISMWLGLYQGHPVVEWATCSGDFDVYEVVRSTDEIVTWPMGDNDTLIATIANGGHRRAWDTEAPQGTHVWYRVFCIRLTDGGSTVFNFSNKAGTDVPVAPSSEPTAPPTTPPTAPPPPPDPISLDSGWLINFEGRLNLTWGTCNVDGFAFYKVVKSTTNSNPSYLPMTEGSVVVATFTDKLAGKYVEWAPDAGQTAYYRVQCIGYQGDHQVLLGQTGVVTVTAP